jgi:hypothetical protein
MAFKELSPKLQLSFDEYIETWRSLVMEYYSRGLAPDITGKGLNLTDEGLIRYSMDLSVIVLIIAIRIWKSRVRVPENIRKKTADAIIRRFYEELNSDAPEKFKEECIKYFNSKYDIFSEICSNLSNKDMSKRQLELIGLARYLVAQVSDRPEKENAGPIERLSLVFVEAAATYLKLTENTAPENQVLSKPKFIVQK